MAASHDALLDALGSAEGPHDRRSREVEARWRQVLEVAREAYVAVDADGRIVDWNRRAHEVFGWTCDEAIGMSAAALLAEGDRTLERLAVHAPGDVTEPFDVAAVDRHGRVFAAECTVWGVDRRGGTVVHAFLHDVTDRRRAEELAGLLTAVVEGTSDAIVTCDLAGRILTWNVGAERTYGWAAQDAVGRRDSFVVPEDKRAELDDMVRRLRQGQRVQPIETERLTPGGTRVPVALSLSPVCDPTGRLVAVSAIARDITEQRWMAETLDATLRALQAAADEARESEAASKRFLADAAHQLRTPVASVRACAETLLRGASPTDAERLLAMLVRETSRAGRLVTSLLRMARLDRGEPFRIEPVDVVHLCVDEVRRLSVLRPALEVVVDARSPAAAHALVDAAACAEILGNLGDNAVRHACRRVEVRVQAHPDRVCVRMRDDGPGLPEADREAVFERFVSLDGRGGSGLGLPIARALARAMGGDLRCDGEFVLTLRSAGDRPRRPAVPGHG